MLSGCLIALGCGRVLALRSTSLWGLFAGTGLVIVALGVVNVCISAAASHIASSREVGGLLGVIDAVESISGIVGPALGGVMERLNPSLPLIMVLSTYALLCA